MFYRKCCYVIEAVGLDVMKIGSTEKLFRRLSHIQTYCPAEIQVLALVPGGRGVEAIMHRQVGGRRVIGEWFSLDDHIREQLAGFRIKWSDLWEEFLFEVQREAASKRPIIADLSRWEVEHV